VSGGNDSAAPTVAVPNTRPSTTIGTATVQPSPNSRTRPAIASGQAWRSEEGQRLTSWFGRRVELDGYFLGLMTSPSGVRWIDRRGCQPTERRSEAVHRGIAGLV
jgi:hypothetical protein